MTERRRRPWLGPAVGLGLLALAGGVHALGLRWLDGHAVLDAMLAPPTAGDLIALAFAVAFLGLRLVLLVLGPYLMLMGLVRLGMSLIPTRE